MGDTAASVPSAPLPPLSVKPNLQSRNAPIDQFSNVLARLPTNTLLKPYRAPVNPNEIDRSPFIRYKVDDCTSSESVSTNPSFIPRRMTIQTKARPIPDAPIIPQPCSRA